MSVTVTGALATGFLRVAPNNGQVPSSTFINFQAGVGITNTGTVTLASGQPEDLAVFNYSPAGAHVIIDVQGYWSPSGDNGYTPLASPCRVLDTRNVIFGAIPTSNLFGPFGVRYLRASGTGITNQGAAATCGVPAEATAVEVAVTVVTPTKSGYLRLAPNNGAEPTTTFINYQAGVGITNTGTVPLSLRKSSDLAAFNYGEPSGTIHLVVDVQGFHRPGEPTSYTPLSVPCRAADTRAGSAGPIAGGSSQVFQIGGAGLTGQGGASDCGIPESASAAEVSVTAVTPLGSGFARVAPNDGSNPTSAFINYRSGVGITNTGTVTLAASDVRDLMIRNFGGSGHFIVDVQGYFSVTSSQPSLELGEPTPI